MHTITRDPIYSSFEIGQRDTGMITYKYSVNTAYDVNCTAYVVCTAYIVRLTVYDVQVHSVRHIIYVVVQYMMYILYIAVCILSTPLDQFEVIYLLRLFVKNTNHLS